MIEQQKTDATNALKNQHKLQADMLTHQYEAQKSVLKAEFDRNVTIATQQFEQQISQLTRLLHAVAPEAKQTPQDAAALEQDIARVKKAASTAAASASGSR